MGGAHSSIEGAHSSKDTRRVVRMSDPDVYRTLQPIMNEFVDLFCIVDPKRHVMLQEFASAFVFHANKKIWMTFSSRQELYVNVMNLLHFTVPTFEVKGFSFNGNYGNDHALTGIALSIYP
jgi:hypothetical protein